MIGAVYADDLPGAAATLFNDGFFARPDAPEHFQLLIRMHGVHLSVFPEAEYGVRQPAPVGARANHFDIAADFAFITQQQGDIVTAMA